jgi:hypothetical protein
MPVFPTGPHPAGSSVRILPNPDRSKAGSFVYDVDTSSRDT